MDTLRTLSPSRLAMALALACVAFVGGCGRDAGVAEVAGFSDASFARGVEVLDALVGGPEALDRALADAEAEPAFGLLEVCRLERGASGLTIVQTGPTGVRVGDLEHTLAWVGLPDAGDWMSDDSLPIVMRHDPDTVVSFFLEADRAMAAILAEGDAIDEELWRQCAMMRALLHRLISLPLQNDPDPRLAAVCEELIPRYFEWWIGLEDPWESGAPTFWLCAPR